MDATDHSACAVELSNMKDTTDVEGVFGFLSYLPAELVVSSVYYALRLLKHRHRLDDRSGIHLIAPGLRSEPTKKDEEIALSITEEIQAREKQSFVHLSDALADKYMSILTDIVLSRAEHDFDANPKRGRELLKHLRNDPSKHLARRSGSGRERSV